MSERTKIALAAGAHLLPGFTASPADEMRAQLSAPLVEKIDCAVELIRQHEPEALSLHPEGYHVAHSGGKDSIVMAELFRMSGVRHQCWYNQTTIDPPELVRFIKTKPEIRWTIPKKALLVMMLDRSNGPPTRLARWCCKEYKERGWDGLFKAVGVRWDESPRRAALWREVTKDRESPYGKYLCPIVAWTDDDVWQFIRDRKLPYCSLYDEGFKRLGCVGCPLGGPNSQRREFARWPGFERAWKNAFRKFWDRWHGVPTLKGGRRWFEDFGCWEKLWDWWCSGEAAPDDAACQQELLFTN